jgi:hypothetical protein
MKGMEGMKIRTDVTTAGSQTPSATVDLADPPRLVCIPDTSITSTSPSSKAFVRDLVPRTEDVFERMVVELRAGRCGNGPIHGPASIRCVGDAVRSIRFTQDPVGGRAHLPDIEIHADTLDWWSDATTVATTLSEATMRAGIATAAAFVADMLEVPRLDAAGCERVRGILGAIGASSFDARHPGHHVVTTAATPWSPTLVRHVTPIPNGTWTGSSVTTTWDETLHGQRAPRVVRISRETAQDGTRDVVRIAPYVVILNGDELPDALEILRSLSSMRTDAS